MYYVYIFLMLIDPQLENLVREMQDSEHGVPVRWKCFVTFTFFETFKYLERIVFTWSHGNVFCRSQKLFLTSIPAAFMGEKQTILICFTSYFFSPGYDLIEWLMDRLCIEDSRKGLFTYYLSHRIRHKDKPCYLNTMTIFVQDLTLSYRYHDHIWARPNPIM